MSQLWELFVLIGKIIWSKTSASFFAIDAFFTSISAYFFVQALYAIVVGLVVLKLIHKVTSYYYDYNYIHRSLKSSIGSQRDLAVFLQPLLRKQRSGGLMNNLLEVRKYLMHLRPAELQLLGTYFKGSIAAVKYRKLLVYAGAVLLGLLTSMALGIVSVQNITFTQTSAIKTVVLILIWLMLVSITMQKKLSQLIQLHGMVETCLQEKKDDPFEPNQKPLQEIVYETST
ncbi:hypothetical protein A374_09933 [Fictibacillus macauensis ZFHKF-1]|uniref:Uncharacterized protein n=1 Tax=Fictibacillus macauensis ZFHKF-1 TaxID=1196324 RepID=I8UFG6_9BACL|nr:hypothetical protein [Fictibacillus macauensis]EIT85548.1 hypothetical protein A374_09933 [Fictibacillus macauensis ZFHKF-1]